ncbi:MAG: YggS family pyridoxal phosphate-dependent enzyme [Alphaproteobacteria bacterium]
MPSQTIDVAANLATILASVEAARKKALSPAPATHVVAVTKGHGEERILPALEAGHSLFGENRVQEAKAKWPALKARFPGVQLHLVDSLQTNKAREAVALFDAIHSLDRAKLARVLKEEMARAGKPLELFVQVNTGEEPQKAGVPPRETVSFVRECQEMGLDIAGLMCIPPLNEEAALHFALLKKLAGECGLSRLSMGMSDDYETAIKFGATHVRIGTAIFGPRPAR